MKFKVVITDYLFEDMEPFLRVIRKIDADLEYNQCKTEEEVIKAAQDADVIFVHHAPITRNVIKTLKKCKLIVRPAVGFDNIDIPAAADYGIYVANVPDYCADDVSDHAIMLILAAVKKLWLLSSNIKKGVWDFNIAKPIYRLKEKTLGLMGFGKIPQEVGRKAQCFGMKVIAYDPFIKPEFAEKANVTLVDLDTLYSTSDVISVHVPLNNQTRYMVNAEAFKKMKKTAFIVNTARGGIINEDDLIQALQNGQIAGAALDVMEKESRIFSTDHPFAKMDQVILTPHSAWYSEESQDALLSLTAEEIVRAYNGEKPRNPVNRPGQSK